MSADHLSDMLKRMGLAREVILMVLEAHRSEMPRAACQMLEMAARHLAPFEAFGRDGETRFDGEATKAGKAPKTSGKEN